MAEPDNKRKKPNYYMQNRRKKYVLEPGLKGFLCSCNFREKECIRESYNILNQYTDLQHPQLPRETVDESDDITDELSKEVNDLKKEQPSQKRFQVVESGAKNFIFIRTTHPDPVELVCSIIKDIIYSKSQKTRFLLRLVPIEMTCKASLVDIKATAEQLIEKHFSGDAKTFAIVFNHRNNNQVNRDEVIKEVAAQIAAKNESHKVDLKNAELTVIVEIIRGVALLSIVPDYLKYKKYNLIQLVEPSAILGDTGKIVENKDVVEDTDKLPEVTAENTN